MKYMSALALQILICITTVTAHAQSTRVQLTRSPQEQRALDAETKAWYSEKLNGTFAYYTVNKDINPKAPNGRRYKIFKDDRFRVYGPPVKNKDGLMIVKYRSLDVTGCAYKTCTMALPTDYLVQLSDYKPGATSQVYEAFMKALTSVGVDEKPCTNCESTRTRREPRSVPKLRPKAPPPDPRALDRSMAWLKNYIQCDEYEYMLTQKQNLLDAERIFGVPAPVIACLIGRESRWDATAVQMYPNSGKMWGSFKGLPQTREASLETERNFHNNEYDAIYRHEARLKLDTYLKKYKPKDKPSIGQLVENNIHYVTGKYSDGKRWRRCGAPISKAQGDKIGRVSIAFVATYLNRVIDDEVETLLAADRTKEALSLRATRRSQFLMAAGGYNAGSGHVFEMTPKEAYTSDSSAWINRMYPPPFVQDAKKRIEKQCSTEERIAADKKKSKPVKTRVRVQTKKGKSWTTTMAVPKAVDVACSKEWLAHKLRASNFTKQAQRAKEKLEEVRPYVKWIEVCMNGDQSERPPNRGPSLTDPKYLEAKNNGCYASDTLKQCPAKPKPKPKAKAKSKDKPKAEKKKGKK